ncbi:MAG: phytanoyl-CoA dioxygenase family protein [Rhodospirillales bacterium]|jgi:hypothetical protein|nr:phytanoyl-CoA dioxygenase family protein [Rhodospirillales bacterium]
MMSAATLSNQQIKAYHRDGFIMPDYQMPDDLLNQMREAYGRIVAENSDTPGVSPNFMLGPHLQKTGAQGVKGDPFWMDLARNDDILDMVSQVAGEDLILWGTTLFGKPPLVGKATPWHQDADYYPIEPMATITVWIAIDDATAENGCMRYQPGSHQDRRGYPHHWNERDDLTLFQEIDDEWVDEDKAVDVIRKAGQISIHDVFIVHGSGANTTPDRRAGFVLRIMPGTSFFNHSKGADSDNPTHDYSKRALFQLRGGDKTGRNDFAVGH